MTSQSPMRRDNKQLAEGRMLEPTRRVHTELERRWSQRRGDRVTSKHSS